MLLLLTPKHVKKTKIYTPGTLMVNPRRIWSSPSYADGSIDRRPGHRGHHRYSLLTTSLSADKAPTAERVIIIITIIITVTMLLMPIEYATSSHKPAPAPREARNLHQAVAI
jgi:hypothetical protein